MKHEKPRRRDPFAMQKAALSEGWHPVETIPLKGEGPFLVLTVSGLVRLARSRKNIRRARKQDGYGPARATVNSVETGNYLAAIAWRWPDPEGLAWSWQPDRH